MVENNTNNKSTIHGEQPRSLQMNWMKYDVTDENVNPNCSLVIQPQKLSPLRQRLRESADQVLQKRQLLTQKEIEGKILEARKRRDISENDANMRRIEPKMRRAEAQ